MLRRELCASFWLPSMPDWISLCSLNIYDKSSCSLSLMSKCIYLRSFPEKGRQPWIVVPQATHFNNTALDQHTIRLCIAWHPWNEEQPIRLHSVLWVQEEQQQKQVNCLQEVLGKTIWWWTIRWLIGYTFGYWLIVRHDLNSSEAHLSSCTLKEQHPES